MLLPLIRFGHVYIQGKLATYDIVTELQPDGNELHVASLSSQPEIRFASYHPALAVRQLLQFLNMNTLDSWAPAQAPAHNGHTLRG